MKRRAEALRPGIAIGPATNNQDFWGICFGRPSAYLFLVLFGGISWITPNLLTVVSFALVIATSAIMVWGDPSLWVLAAILLQLNLTLDCADGQLARYRKISSPLGSYLDKITDFLGFLILFAALAELSIQRTGDLWYMHLAFLGVFAPVMVGYVKWLAVADSLKKGQSELDAAPPGPERVTWWRVVLKIVEFREPDLYLWVGLALCLQHPEWSLLVIGISQPLVLIVALVYRGRQLTRPSGDIKEGTGS
ncbi:MAG: hypothetical protein CMH54_02500 [Myxococcales bacterium]|nr:hypothetical protein [Myxococcales bacterium]